MSTCTYTSSEGRKCRNISIGNGSGIHCVHHTCGAGYAGCEKVKGSRWMACPTCLVQMKRTLKVENSPMMRRKVASKPTDHDKAVLAAKAMTTEPPTEHMQHVLKLFDGKRSTKADVAHKFNYSAVEFSAEEIFRMYDEDNSGTIDGHELAHVLADCGVKVTPDSIAMARHLLGLNHIADTCSFEAFVKWWNATHAKSREARRHLLEHLGEEIQEFLIPELKTLFAEYDVDCSGALDKDEFDKFYPKLKEFLGYDIPPKEQCLADMDSMLPEDQKETNDGLIEYPEFELWFLKNEKTRAANAAN